MKKRALIILIGSIVLLSVVIPDRVAWYRERALILVLGRYGIPHFLGMLTMIFVVSAAALSFWKTTNRTQRTFRTILEWFCILGYTLFPLIAANEWYWQHHLRQVVNSPAVLDARQSALLSLADAVPDAESGYLSKPFPETTVMRGAFGLASLYKPEALREQPSPVIEYRTDSLGFRNDREIAQAGMIALGDSFTNGAYVERDQIWSTLAARELGLEECNLGVPGYGPQQSLSVWKRFGISKKPKLVISQIFYGNDIDDSARCERWKKSGLTFLAFTRAELGSMPSLCLTKAFVQGILPSFSTHETGELKWEPVVSQLKNGSLAMGFLPKTSVWVLTQDQVRAHPGFAPMIDALEKTKHTCEQNGIQYFVCLVPDKVSVYYDFITDPEMQYRLLEQQFDPRFSLDSIPQTDNPYITMREHLDNQAYAICSELQKRNIPFLDLTELFREHVRDTGEMLYYPFDSHWNPAGHALAAKFVVKWMNARTSFVNR